jgi:hypothetical protein
MKKTVSPSIKNAQVPFFKASVALEQYKEYSTFYQLVYQSKKQNKQAGLY